MARIESTRILPHPPERVFEFLSDLRNHWQLDESFAVHDGGVVIHGPLGISRTVRTHVVAAQPPRRLAGRAEIGAATSGAILWTIDPADGGSRVSLEATVERAAPADRLLLALGGRAWLRRRFASVLQTLERRLR